MPLRWCWLLVNDRVECRLKPLPNHCSRIYWDRLPIHPQPVQRPTLPTPVDIGDTNATLYNGRFRSICAPNPSNANFLPLHRVQRNHVTSWREAANCCLCNSARISASLSRIWSSLSKETYNFLLKNLLASLVHPHRALRTRMGARPSGRRASRISWKFEFSTI